VDLLCRKVYEIFTGKLCNNFKWFLSFTNMDLWVVFWIPTVYIKRKNFKKWIFQEIFKNTKSRKCTPIKNELFWLLFLKNFILPKVQNSHTLSSAQIKKLTRWQFQNHWQNGTFGFVNQECINFYWYAHVQPLIWVTLLYKNNSWFLTLENFILPTESKFYSLYICKIQNLKKRKNFLFPTSIFNFYMQSTPDIRHPVRAGQSVSYIGGKFKGLSYNWD
jgi:hypothetical protein